MQKREHRAVNRYSVGCGHPWLVQAAMVDDRTLCSRGGVSGILHNVHSVHNVAFSNCAGKRKDIG